MTELADREALLGVGEWPAVLLDAHPGDSIIWHLMTSSSAPSTFPHCVHSTAMHRTCQLVGQTLLLCYLLLLLLHHLLSSSPCSHCSAISTQQSSTCDALVAVTAACPFSAIPQTVHRLCAAAPVARPHVALRQWTAWNAWARSEAHARLRFWRHGHLHRWVACWARFLRVQ